MKKNFNEVFNSLKTEYEKKERKPREIQAYEFLKKMIKQYGYNNVCDKISLNKQNNKYNELGIFIDDIKNNLSLEILCSQMFYLDDSISYNPEINKEQSDIKKIGINGREINVLFKSEKKEVKNDNHILLKKIN